MQFRQKYLMPVVYLNSDEIPYRVLFSLKRKTISVEVKLDTGLTVHAPVNTQDDIIKQFILQKEDWILSKLDRLNEIAPVPKSKDFVNGERLTYIGRSYRLDVRKYEKQRIQFAFNQGKFILQIPRGKEIEKSKLRSKVIEWYKVNASKKIQDRIKYLAPKVGKYPSRVKVREFKTRWGTCQDDDSLDFNWRIIMAPISIIDYVIVHELSHLLTKDHSKPFWSKLSTIIVDHDKRKEWLRINGSTLTL